MRYPVGIVALGLLFAAAGAAAATPRQTQALRTCVDRWNEANMRDWGGYPAAWVGLRRLDRNRLLEVGMRFRPRRCVVMVAVGQGQSWSCVLDRFGAYACPLRHEGDPVRLRHPNARVDKRGVLRPSFSLAGTHPSRRLNWQRYPRREGYVEPWARSGKLRPGLRFGSTYSGGGSCDQDFGSEMTSSARAIRCLWRGLYQVDPCFAPPGRWNRRGGVVACSTGPGATTFGRFVIGPPSYRAVDFPEILPWSGIGAIQLGDSRRDVRHNYDEAGHRYHARGGYYVLHGSRVYVTFRNGVVDDIGFTTRYYRTLDGFGVGSRIPLGPCHRTALKSCEHRWHGFVWNAIVKFKPCSCWVKVGDGARSLPATGANFLKHWTILTVRGGRVTRIYFSQRYID
jgi:hypothetical protein